MKKQLLLVIILIISVSACKEQTNKDVASDQNENFDSFKEEFLQNLWKQSPGWASWAGLHEYDSILNIDSEENKQKYLNSLKEMDAKLQQFELANLDDKNKIDYHLIENSLESSVWWVNEFKGHEWDASGYNIAGRVWTIVNGDYADLDTRLEILSALLKNVPAYYESGIENLTRPTMEHLDLGYNQNQGALHILGEQLLDSISSSTLSDATKETLLARVQSSKEAVSNYIATLEKLKVELADGKAESPRIGKKLYDKNYALQVNSGYTADEIYNKALKEKKKIHAKMIEISDSIWDNHLAGLKKPTDEIVMIKMLIDKIAEKHVAREDFVDEIKRQMPILASFVTEHDLLTQDPSKPLVVREMPVHMRGVSGASVSSPGPYEKGKDTYYNVTPLDGYSDEEAESNLREYNHYILQILNIHEGIPGHYTQLVYGNESPSIIKTILANGAMVEGWANYAEIMMLEEGYNESPEMWLMWYKWQLRSVTNTILDYSYHVLDLQKEDAMKLMIAEAFQEKTEAEEKWVRVTLTSVQLTSYFTGFSEIYELRDEMKTLKGDDFDLKEFHEQFLSYGNAPVKYIRELMIK
ncbi:DUF885 domain-containing protein [Ulvibacter antarcticus]|uniref:Uncharacterized protein (DUF885 family) n=1 Tax=Ulvibacter antarcticus TaxID=442714 RepID=A0A3L9YCS7_9FLAO|nr:DUF885 domain-containing protein [Ulvibacter antarcticus]RMA58496.1 uncharacterized protein (DUF885 family) [Ulvibacter antarcticus]